MRHMHTYSGILVSRKKSELLTHVATWRNLEDGGTWVDLEDGRNKPNAKAQISGSRPCS